MNSIRNVAKIYVSETGGHKKVNNEVKFRFTVQQGLFICKIPLMS